MNECNWIQCKKKCSHIIIQQSVWSIVPFLTNLFFCLPKALSRTHISDTPSDLKMAGWPWPFRTILISLRWRVLYIDIGKCSNFDTKIYALKLLYNSLNYHIQVLRNNILNCKSLTITHLHDNVRIHSKISELIIYKQHTCTKIKQYITQHLYFKVFIFTD